MSLLGFQAALSPAAVSTAAYSPAELCLSLLVGWLLGCGITIFLLELRARRKRTASRELPSKSATADSAEVAPGSDLIKLLARMQEHRERGDFSQRVEIDLHSDVCQLAAEYNRVLDRAKAEIANREEAEQQFRGIFDNAIEGIFQTTPDGKYLRANTALARIYGFKNAEELIVGLPDIAAQLYVDPSRRNEFIRLLETHDVITAFESQVYRADGSVIWISENARAHRNANGDLLYYEGSVEDVTERRDSERLLREKCAAETANRAKSEFLANMSHEIRTPLNGVVGMLDLLGSTPLTAQQTRYAEIAKSSAAVLLNLINDILDFSKVEAGKLEIEHVPFDLRQVVEDVPEMFLHAAAQKKVELSCHVAASVPRTVRGDSERVRQILVNLVGNAIKFTPQGSVTLRVANEPGSVDSARPSIRFSVTDTGVGIPTDRRHRLFHAFSQVDASTTRRFGGTGLGLAICRQLVEALGGQIGVESCVGEGSTFWMVLPLEVVEGRSQTPVELPLGLSASNVLVLDDNQTNLEILHDQLTNWGLHTDLHTSPELALASLRTAAADGHPFEIAILDGLLPQTTGVEMAEAIRQDPLLAHTRLLLLTSQHHGLPMDEAEKLGMTVLHKPVRQSRLYDALLNLASDGNTRRNAVQTADQAAASTPTVTGGGQVLIVDDNEINRIVAEEIVISAGHRATLVSGGYEAIEALRQRRFDLVLMDCEMPELDGFIATEEIRRLEAAGQLRHQKEGEMMIVALTAQAVAGDHERCLAAGMNDYLTKPIDRRKLLAVLAAIRPGETTSRPRRELRPSRSAGKPHVENRMETAEKAIDLDDLSQRCGGKTDFVTRVLSRFRDDAVRRRTELSQALTPDELNRLAREAHAIKGAAANVSARTVSHAAGVLEQAAKNGQLEACRDAEAALQQSLDHCLEQIDLLLSEETKTL